MTVHAAVLGASGYTGAELLRLLPAHPAIEVVVATAESQAGQAAGVLYPHLKRYRGLPLQRLADVRPQLDACRVVFCGLPHGEAMKILPELGNDLVVDLGGDFRLDDPGAYEEWYGTEHTAARVLPEWTYGLPELFRDRIRKARRIASPGCYPTAAILAMAPFVASRAVGPPIVVDAVSGTSGAGRVPKPNLHFAAVHEDVRAYKVGFHQHTPEIEMALGSVGPGAPVIVSFTAHLVPMTRGIHATCSAQLTADAVDAADVMSIADEFYADSPFVHVTDTPPGTKDVRGTNMAALHPVADRRTGRLIVTCVIDNLTKGASGQAIQNANLALGLDETLGLPMEGLWP